MKLAIYTTATAGYTHALEAQARKICACILANNHPLSAVLVMLVTDQVDAVEEARAVYAKGIPGVKVEVLADARFKKHGDNYKTECQLLIAQMRTMACARAIGWGADMCLSLDGDVLPPPNALRCMIDMLRFDRGYYGVTFCPYPSHGGGAFLGGRGTPQNPILPDFYEDEKDLPDGLLEERKELEKDWKANHKRLKEIELIIKSAPPLGNVFASNAKNYRRRGWFDNAYPAIGKGAVVPVDWTGCGCTLMNREALALCDWIGYNGGGTEDLFLNFVRWQANGIRMACIPHCPCDHVVRKPDSAGLYVHVLTYHETEGECAGHLRQRNMPWHPHAPGERYDPKNDGVMNHALSSEFKAKKPAPKAKKSPSKAKWTPLVRSKQSSPPLSTLS
jgi:hypothetical protein